METSDDPSYVHVTDKIDTTVGYTILSAEPAWSFAVTDHRYDEGTTLLG